MGVDRPGITPARRKAKAKPLRSTSAREAAALRNLERATGRPISRPASRKPAARPKPAPARGGVFGPQGRTGEASTPKAIQRPVRTAPARPIRRSGPRPKVDTGNILAGAGKPSAAEVRRAGRAKVREAERKRQIAQRQSALGRLLDAGGDALNTIYGTGGSKKGDKPRTASVGAGGPIGTSGVESAVVASTDDAS